MLAVAARGGGGGGGGCGGGGGGDGGGVVVVVVVVVIVVVFIMFVLCLRSMKGFGVMLGLFVSAFQEYAEHRTTIALHDATKQAQVKSYSNVRRFCGLGRVSGVLEPSRARNPHRSPKS